MSAVRELVKKHVYYTNSAVGRRILDHWTKSVSKFVKVMPRDYRNTLDELENGPGMHNSVHDDMRLKYQD